MKIHRSAAVYFALQGIAVFAWWLLLVCAPATRAFFQLETNSEISLLAFWLADTLLLGAGSLLAAYLCKRQSESAPLALWFVAGAFGYAVFYCFAFALMTDRGWLGVALMTPALIWSGNFAIALSSIKNSMFRQAKESSAGWLAFKTLIQIVVVWSLILVVIPYFIVRLEDKLGIARLEFPGQKLIASALFIFISTLGLSGALTMARIGKGTPLPLDATRKLVISGIYAYVRNPMAISGIGQGLAVALFFGSPLTAVYAVMGAFIWQLIFRPLEEEDLRRNFGTDYENYRRTVRCWIPRRRRYQIESTADSSNSISAPFGKI